MCAWGFAIYMSRRWDASYAPRRPCSRVPLRQRDRGRINGAEAVRLCATCFAQDKRVDELAMSRWAWPLVPISLPLVAGCWNSRLAGRNLQGNVLDSADWCWRLTCSIGTKPRSHRAAHNSPTICEYPENCSLSRVLGVFDGAQTAAQRVSLLIWAVRPLFGSRVFGMETGKSSGLYFGAPASGLLPWQNFITARKATVTSV